MKTDTSILDNWQTLCTEIKKEEYDEKALKDLMEAERTGKRRPQFLLRIYGRYNTLRTARERQELVSE